MYVCVGLYLPTSIGSSDGEHSDQTGVIMLKSITQQLATLHWSTTINTNVLIAL